MVRVMSTRGPAPLALVLAVTFAGSARATTGTCTILDLHQPSVNLDFDFLVPIANGLAMPVEFDETAGTFAMQRDAWSSRFGNDGAVYDTLNGIHGYLTMQPGTVQGTIDAAGNVTLPGFAIEISTDFESILDPSVQHLTHIPLDPTISTGITETTIGHQGWPTEGAPLDFTTGVLTLAGTDVLRNAPGANSDNASGIVITCQLNPIPNRAQLPRAPALHARGKVTSGAAGTGDTLVLRAKLLAGKAGLPFGPTDDLFIRLSAGGHEVVLLLVTGGTPTRKGHTLRVTDTDGTAIQVLHGGTPLGTSGTAPTTGTLRVKVGKRSAIVVANVTGLALAEFADSTTVTLTDGAAAATTNVTVRGGGTVRKFR
jgi:hypothetical protein